MEVNKVEMETLNKAVTESTEAQIKELNDLQLTHVGGGIAIVIVA